MGFAEFSVALHSVTSRNKDFVWTAQMMESFENRKEMLNSRPLRAFLDFEAPFIVETDASRVDIGADLAQKKEDGKAHLI